MKDIIFSGFPNGAEEIKQSIVVPESHKHPGAYLTVIKATHQSVPALIQSSKVHRLLRLTMRRV